MNVLAQDRDSDRYGIDRREGTSETGGRMP